MNIKKALIAKIVNLNPRRFAFLSDKQYIQLKFYDAFGRFMDFNEPRTFNEKLQWLKVYDHNSQYTTMVDKYAVKKYIAKKIGSEYIIPTLGAWDRFDDIDFEALPNQFVLKCTHDSGGLVICKDKAKLDIKQARKKIETSLSNNFYYMGREWPYKNVPHKIIVEQYMADNLRDYKLFCFNDVPRMTLVCSERFTKDGLKEDFYDEAWNHLNVQRAMHGNAVFPIERPKQYELMKKLAAKLSEKMPFARIDFYEINEKIYFGEITFYPASGFEGFIPEAWDLKLGDWIKLPGGGYRLNSNDYSIIISDSFYNNKETKALVDYKFFCFNGIAESVMVCTERETGHPKFYFFDKEWNLRKYNIRGKEAPEGFTLPKPDCIDEMFSIAERLSKGIPFVRVDLYCIDGLVYFGEMTFYPDSGFDVNLLKESNEHWGEMLILPEKRG
ncbi:ATP-grasp fold amidoligase family protein [Faecalicoccus pleomorphus]|uniref:ATP-grasp fold amidoligase family protein n=1 Tax=Faecalicoccus pleomorphus TaxID=1323 RepID=UPI0014301F71|nr:ATP-grasp fold amidoligase family protein [Faecalicoccus pleomorphus]